MTKQTKYSVTVYQTPTIYQTHEVSGDMALNAFKSKLALEGLEYTVSALVAEEASAGPQLLTE